MQFSLPSFETLLEIHDIMLEFYGGLKGVPHPEYLESALARPQHHMSYAKNCDIHLVSALILDSIARNHAFSDGNKRTALVAMLMTYRLNGVELSYDLRTNEELENLAISIADDKEKRVSVQMVRNKLLAIAAENMEKA
jgi:death-on-curing protein